MNYWMKASYSTSDTWKNQADGINLDKAEFKGLVSQDSQGLVLSASQVATFRRIQARREDWRRRNGWASE